MPCRPFRRPYRHGIERNRSHRAFCPARATPELALPGSPFAHLQVEFCIRGRAPLLKAESLALPGRRQKLTKRSAKIVARSFSTRDRLFSCVSHVVQATVRDTTQDSTVVQVGGKGHRSLAPLWGPRVPIEAGGHRPAHSRLKTLEILVVAGLARSHPQRPST